MLYTNSFPNKIIICNICSFYLFDFKFFIFNLFILQFRQRNFGNFVEESLNSVKRAGDRFQRMQENQAASAVSIYGLQT